MTRLQKRKKEKPNTSTDWKDDPGERACKISSLICRGKQLMMMVADASRQVHIIFAMVGIIAVRK